MTPFICSPPHPISLSSSHLLLFSYMSSSTDFQPLYTSSPFHYYDNIYPSVPESPEACAGTKFELLNRPLIIPVSGTP